MFWTNFEPVRGHAYIVSNTSCALHEDILHFRHVYTTHRINDVATMPTMWLGKSGCDDGIIQNIHISIRILRIRRAFTHLVYITQNAHRPCAKRKYVWFLTAKNTACGVYFFTWFKCVPVFGSNGTGVPVFGFGLVLTVLT